MSLLTVPLLATFFKEFGRLNFVNFREFCRLV